MHTLPHAAEVTAEAVGNVLTSPLVVGGAILAIGGVIAYKIGKNLVSSR